MLQKRHLSAFGGFVFVPVRLGGRLHGLLRKGDEGHTPAPLRGGAGTADRRLLDFPRLQLRRGLTPCLGFGLGKGGGHRFEGVGALARQARSAGFGVTIVTGDKDFYQLVDEDVRVYNPRDEGTWYDAQGVVEKFGIHPESIPDYLALVGDTADGVPGLPS